MDPVTRQLETPQESQAPEPPLTALVGRLSDDLQQLARREAQLAKHELSESFDRAKQQVVALAIGTAALAVGLLTLVAAAVAALAVVLPVWAASLLVGAVLSGVGVVLFLNGKAQLARVSFAPDHAIRSLQNDVSAIKKAAA